MYNENKNYSLYSIVETKEMIEFSARVFSKTERNFRSKGMPIFVVHCRVCNTAISVVNKIKDVPFDELTLSLYVACKDTGFDNLAHKFESMIELASANKERFVDKLFKLLDDASKYIIANNLQRQFFQFVRYFMHVQYQAKTRNEFMVLTAYQDLVLETIEMLKPNRYALNDILAGYTNDGEPIIIKDYFLNLDLPAYEINLATKNIIRANKKLSTEYLVELISKAYEKYGYENICSPDDIDALNGRARAYYNNISSLSSYINENTVDILPSRPFESGKHVADIPRRTKEIDLEQMIRRRKKMLPSSGLKIEISNSKSYCGILLKEVFENDAIVLLFKLETILGDISGYYNTKTGENYSIFFSMGSGFIETHERIMDFALWAYASYTSTYPDVVPTAENYLKYFNDIHNVELKYITRNVLAYGTRSGHIDTAKYESKQNNIAGYVRRLPDGQHASEKSISIAESLGLFLSDGETYISPFVRSSWVLKRPQ